jgi:hypothetical protein
MNTFNLNYINNANISNTILSIGFEDVFGKLATLPEHQNFITNIIKLLKNNNLTVVYKYHQSNEINAYEIPIIRINRSINLMKSNIAEPITMFEVEGTIPTHLNCDLIDSGNTMSTTYYVIDPLLFPELNVPEIDRFMIGLWCYCITNIERKQIRKDQMLAVDADASGNFWKNVGMIYNKRAGYDRKIISKRPRETEGFEKVIEFHKLSKWATEIIFTAPKITKKKILKKNNLKKNKRNNIK